MKKILAGMAASCIALSTLSTPALAATRMISSKSTTVSDSSEGLQSAIINVKSKITIPKELTEFSYNYVENNYTLVPYWNLTWRDKEYNSSINVKCDKNGNISYYNIRNYEEEKMGPKYLKEELLDKAIDGIRKLSPNIADKLVFDKAIFNGVYSGTYTYNFVRVENGINMPDNKVSITLKYDTGEVTSFSSAWEYDVEIPSSETKISEKEAKDKIGKNVKMSLEYRNKTEELDGKKTTKAYLVYVPDKSYVAVDAKTGEIYNTHDEFYSMDEYNTKDELKNMAMESSVADQANGITFSEQELEKIDEIKGLISKDEAVSIITREESFYIHENAKAVDARLSLNYDYLNDEEKGYIWNINISDPRAVKNDEEDTYRASISARVDAKTGKILSFSSNMPGYYNSGEWKTLDVKYSREECKNILERFIKETEPEKFKKSKLSDESRNGYLLKIINDERIYGGYSYLYNRYNEGIEYSYNNIRGAVDGVTGKIYSYSTNWNDDVVFESPRNAMSEREAYNAYVSTDGFELVYEINNKHYIEDNRKSKDYYDYNELYLLEKEARLVYRTNVNPAIISPFTGKQLGFNGEVFEDDDEKEYKDIDDFWAQRQIKLITDLNVNFEGENFLPNKEITEKEFCEVLSKIGFYRRNNENKEERNSLTKIETIKLVIDSMGLTKIAELKDIYRVEFSDLDEISYNDIGYVALAKAIGIISGDEFGKLNPNKNVTRAEAVIMALNLINCNINR